MNKLGRKEVQKSKEGFSRYFSFLKENGLSDRLIWSTILFRVLTSLLEVGRIGLLIPLAKGIIGQDFSFLKDSSVWEWVSLYFPQMAGLSFFSLFTFLTLVIFFITLIKVVISYYGNLYLTAQRLAIASNTNQYVFSKYLQLGMPFYNKGEGSSESYFFLRFAIIVRGLLDSFDRIIDVGISFLSLSFIMLYLSPFLYLIALMVLPVVLLLNNTLKNRIKSSMHLDDETEQAFPVAINNAFLRLPLTFIFNKESHEVDQFRLNNKDFEKRRFEYEKRISMVQPLNEVLILILLLVFSILIGRHYLSQSLDVAKGLVFFYAFQRFISIGKDLVMALYIMMRPTMRIKKAFDVIDKYEQFSVPSGKKEFPGLQSDIQLNELTFSYPGKNNAVLKKLRLRIRKGKMTSIVGKTGSGKSTLVKLLLRLYDCPPGSILIDGEDIRTYSNASIRSHISFVNQDPILFKGTIFENVIYGARREVNKQEVKKMLIALGGESFLKSLPEGLSSEVTEMGSNLSGGERQMLALVRSLLNETEIIIFDEPTSSMDALTESSIKKVVDEFSAGKTVIVIAHRLSTIKNSDHVVVIENGKIVERGKLKRLLSEESRFREYWEAQSLDLGEQGRDEG